MSKNHNVKQKTLFQAWNKKDPSKQTKNNNTKFSKTKYNKFDDGKVFNAQQVVDMECIDAIDLTDDDLIEAAELMESTIAPPSHSNSNMNQNEVEYIDGFENSLGHIWIYPTNYPIREYQFSIVKSSLMKNTLVSLPTGLGKTFIAAVVMYNFYRWYPQGKIVFMAPTKPLVSQQIEACYKIMGIPLQDQAEITGMTTSVHKREALWNSKRVFFLTPQVINNDLARGVCPALEIKCVVIDEAHKAQGKHAYCQVINQLASCSRNFRVLALSATPGTDVKSVQQVITNLLISHIEIRSEDSIDIQSFSHQRKVEKVVCKLDETMTKMKDNYLKVIEIFTKSLVNRRALFDRETSSYSKYGLLMARDQFRKDPPSGLNKYEMGSVEGDFATCISLFHGLELLQQHGMRSFFIFLKAMMEGDKGNMRAKSVLGANALFREMYQNLTNMFGESPNPTVLLTQAGQTQQSLQKGLPSAHPYVYSHPKMKKLEEVVLNHFKDFTKSHGDDSTRVMVFCQYRDSVQEITELLQNHRPLVRPMQFVGHSTASGKIAKFTQKDQLMVVSKFREGGYNTLISTCVGEEGLDIGDVDLIVCFDAHKSPIRLVQRMGRTGRKRKGRIVMLVTEGKEERDYNSSLSNRKSIQKAITGNSSRGLQFYQHNPRMVPQGLNPEVFKMFMTIEKKPEPTPAVSKFAKKKNARKTENLDISVMLKNVEARDPIFLNQEQIKEWNDMLKLNSKEKEMLKILPAGSRMMCLDKKKNQNSPSTKQPMLSLSEWTDWQTRFQSPSVSGHSSVTNNFVEIMEICDLVKQSDEKSFDENLAPFLGGKYNKLKIGTEKKNILDSFLVPKEKPLKKITKQKIPDQKIEQKNLSPEMSTDTDFEPAPLKKIFPEKKNFKSKLLEFSVNNVSSESNSRDDTLTGIESILHDPESSSNTSVRNLNGTKIESQGNTVVGDKRNDEDVEEIDMMPDFDIGDWESNDNSRERVDENENRNINKEEEVLNEQKFEQITTFDSKDQKIRLAQKSGINVQCASECPESNENSLLMKLIDNLSAIPTETPVLLPINKNQSRRNSIEIDLQTPSSFSSIDLDSMDEFDNSDFEDCETKLKNQVKPLKRACFALRDDDNENNTFDDSLMLENKENTKKAVNTVLTETEAKLEDNFNEDVTHSAENKTDRDVIQNSNEPDDRTRSSLIPTSSKNNSISKNEMTTDADVHTIQNSVNQTKKAPDKQATFNTSADMFDAEFDVNFDFGSFDDFENSHESFTEKSPVLKTKRRSSNNFNPKSSPEIISIKPEEKVETSLAHVTLTQRVENRALFADLPKCQSDVNIPVAEVKPQRSSSFINLETNDAIPTTTEHVQVPTRFEGNGNPEMGYSDNDTLQEKIQQPNDSLKRKREFNDDNNNSTFCKRQRKISNGSSFVEFKSPKFETPKILRSSEDSEESPICIRKKRTNKLLFSPESELSQLVFTPNDKQDPDEHKRNLLRSLHPKESPIIAAHRNIKKMTTNKHSTPKCPKFSNDEEDSSDDAFVGNNNNPKKQRRYRMKNFVEDEAEVSDDGVNVSSDEDEELPEDLEEMRNFMNDATVLTQHVAADESTIDEHAMYLQSKPDFFGEPSKFEGHNGKFKLAYGVGQRLDVFSQEVSDDVSGYEEDSFVCDEIEHDDNTDLGEITLLENPSNMSKQRVTRRQAELNRLRKMNYDDKPVSPVVSKLKKQFPNKNKQSRKRIVYMDDSTDSIESGNTSLQRQNDTAERSSKISSGTWSCPACTLENSSTLQICKLCDSEKPNHSGVKDTKFYMWACDLCTYVNRGPHTVCDMCDAKYVDPTSMEKCSTSKNVQKIVNPSGNCSYIQNTSLQKNFCDKNNHMLNKVQSSDTSKIKSPVMKSSFHQRSLADAVRKEVSEEDRNSDPRSEDVSCDIISATPQPQRKMEFKKRSNATIKDTTLKLSTSSSQSSQTSVTSSLGGIDREERLRRCRQKQLEFRARMEKRRSIQSSGEQKASISSSASSDLSKTTPGRTTSSILSSSKTSLQFDSPQSSRSDLINSSLNRMTSEPTNTDKLVVLVDSKELSSSQPIITTLRCKHKVYTVVASLPHCDYIVGRGTAVERKMVSDLSQVSGRQKIISRFQQLNRNYDRVYLIIEQDRIKKGDMSGGRAQHSSYYVSTVCSLSQANVRILYSDNQNETADLLHMLSTREKNLKRPVEFDAAEKANDAKFRTVLRLYTSIPKVSFVSALYMCLNFKNFKEVAASSVEKLIQKAHLSTCSAAEVYNFCRRNFDLQMTPSR
uniref:Fanconi anemia group M protein-like isoform X1 n=1 Tax=Styela clava TaxID=7725 RepID=UPI00193A98F9|nr:Fanconi anemia group M protein-like isoform X1 [Styela clava]